jgi:hypothetical protein
MKVAELFESEVKYAIGEKIQTKVGGKWIDATITKPPNKNGNYGVRFKVGTTVMNYVSAPVELRKKVAEGKEEQLAQVRKDYKNAMNWVNAPKSEVPDHERAKWERLAQKLRDHAKKQFKVDLNEDRLDELSVDTLASYRSKRLKQRGEVFAKDPYATPKGPKDPLSDKVHTGVHRAHRKELHGKSVEANKKDPGRGSIQRQYYSGESGSRSGD